MNDIITAAIAIAAIGLPATEAVKRAIATMAGPSLDVNQFAPLISIAICVALTFLAPVEALSTVPTQLGAGFAAGLMSCGAWSATKATAMGK